MQHPHGRIGKFLNALSFPVAAKCAAPLKVSFIIGSTAAFFSLANCIVPLSGAFFGISGSLVMLFMGCIGKISLGTLSPLLLAYHIPGFFASLYWATRSSIIRFWAPLTCIALFILHPVGAQAAPYALYWLIPLALYNTKRNSLWLTALGSTFVAHGVGSVIWLYCTPTTPLFWLGLIPVVFVERILFASGMVVLHAVISQGIAWTNEHKTSAAISSFTHTKIAND